MMIMKRVFDIISSAIGLILLSPIFLIIALLIKSTSAGGVFFRQDRVGLNGQIFSIYKFRTMVTNAESLGPKITIGKDSRITTIGHILRKTKLDELPQLIDVFLGKMSIVGPRPEVPEYVAFYPTEVKDIVLSVRPGITDWASIKMIDENLILDLSDNPKETYIQKIMPEKLDFAVKYVKTRTFKQDLLIILMTFVKIIKR